MIDYSKGKIYTIRYRNDSSLVYVGSTCQELYKRWGKHKENILYKLTRECKSLFYETIRKTNDLDNWYIELYENYSCQNKQELNKREGEVQREIATLNMNISGRTYQEWYNDNVNLIKEYQYEYRKKNKDIVIERSKEWYKNNVEHKKEYDKNRRVEKADIIREKKKEYNKCIPDIICECGCKIKKSSLKNHLKTKQHAENLTTMVNC